MNNMKNTKTPRNLVCRLALQGGIPALAALGLVMSVSATEVSTLEIRTTNSSKFSYVCSCKPGVNYPEGKPTILHQGFFNEGGGEYANCSERLLLQFDLPRLPITTIVASARLDLRCMMFYGQPSGSLVYARILEPWNKDAVTFRNQPQVSTNDMITLTTWPRSETWFSIDMTDWVRGWIQGTYTNYGFIGYSSGSRVTSSLMLYAPGSGATTRPKLTLVLKSPSPARLDCTLKERIYEITLHGDTNGTYALESSTNFVDWTPQVQLEGTNLPCLFRTQTDQCRCQFYRSVLLDWKQ